MPSRRSSNEDVVAGKPATIYDVARLAGVSPSTVSRTMRATAPVAVETRRRVSAAMNELRFVPSRLGVSLAEGRHAANGIVFPDLAGPYFADVVLGYEQQAGELDRSVIILSTHGRAAARDKVMELAARVDGLVVLGRAVGDDVVAEVAATGRAVVTLARPPVRGADAVGADNAGGATALGHHLVGHGHRRLVLLGDHRDSPDVAARWSGLHAALAEAGSPVTADEVPSHGFDVEAGYRAAEAVLHRNNRPDVVVCANDEIALGVLECARDAGIDVPGELAITGWDDIMAARWAGLTTVRQPMRELGAFAARILDRRITDPAGRRRHEVLRTELVVRTSCGHHA